MKRVLATLLGLIVLFALYLAFAPVSIDPQAWEAPKNIGYSGVFSPNDKLANLERIDPVSYTHLTLPTILLV